MVITYKNIIKMHLQKCRFTCMCCPGVIIFHCCHHKTFYQPQPSPSAGLTGYNRTLVSKMFILNLIWHIELNIESSANAHIWIIGYCCVHSLANSAQPPGTHSTLLLFLCGFACADSSVCVRSEQSSSSFRAQSFVSPIMQKTLSIKDKEEGVYKREDSPFPTQTLSF